MVAMSFLGTLALLGSGSAATTPPAACLRSLATPPPAKEVFAFCPGSEWKSYNWTTITTIAAYHEGSRGITDWAALLCHAHQHGARVVLATGACPSLDAATPSGARCPANISSPAAQDIFVRYWVNRTNAEGLDGLNLDIEGGIMPSAGTPFISGTASSFSFPAIPASAIPTSAATVAASSSQSRPRSPRRRRLDARRSARSCRADGLWPPDLQRAPRHHPVFRLAGSGRHEAALPLLGMWTASAANYSTTQGAEMWKALEIFAAADSSPPYKSDDSEPRSSSGGGVYLFTPDMVDAAHTTMARRVGRLAKDEQPVIRQEHPWENAIFLCGQSVIEVGNQLYLYYTTHTGTPVAGRATSSVLCLATSANGGRTWTKPSLGLVEYAGSKANNIVIALGGDCNGGNVFVDDNPATAADERFKFTSTSTQPLVLYVSPDGIHFTRQGVVAGIWSRVGDTQPSLMWDGQSQNYLMYGRIDAWGAGTGARSCGNGSVNGHTAILSAMRKVGFSRASNLSIAPPTDPYHKGTWTNVSLALGLPPSTDDGGMDCAVDTYNSAAVMVHNAYIMMPSQFLHDGAPTFPFSHAYRTDGVLDVRLAVSGNASGPFDWLDETFIPRGIGAINTSATGSHWHYTGEWDAGYIFAVRGFHTTATRTTIFYMGSQNTHGNYPTIWTYTNATTAIGRATMRKDGWWSYDAEGAGEQTLRTTPLRLPSAPASLFVNMESSVRGSLRAEVLDAATLQPLPGLSLNDSVPLMGNFVRQLLSWKSGAELPAGAGTGAELPAGAESELPAGAGRSVRLRFVALSAKLFSFEVSG